MQSTLSRRVPPVVPAMEHGDGKMQEAGECVSESDVIANIVKLFFSKETIVHSMSCILRGIAPYHTDPMTHIVVTLSREPLRLALTDRGLAPVKSDPSIYIPYSKMSKAQLQSLKMVLAIWNMSAMYGSTTQMGGGMCVYELKSRGTQTFVDAVLLLYSVALLMRSCPASDYATSKTLSNVVLQRILSSVVLPREVISKAESMLRADALAVCS